MNYIDITLVDRTINLGDSRTLGYAEFGEPDGKPLIFFHGFPGSRLDWTLICDERRLSETGTWVIAPDWPGFGLSDHKRNRTMSDWPDDVLELADSLGFERFAVLGISGGGPYAAACAAGIGDRISNAGIVCGMGPKDAPGAKDGSSWTIPGLPKIIRRFILTLMKKGLYGDPQKFLQRTLDTFSEIDKSLLDNGDLANTFLKSLKEALRSGAVGTLKEAELFSGDWDFSLDDIRVPVYLWHGGQDRNVPIAVGQYVAASIPECHSHFLEDEGHLTLPRNHIKSILMELNRTGVGSSRGYGS